MILYGLIRVWLGYFVPISFGPRMIVRCVHVQPIGAVELRLGWRVDFFAAYLAGCGYGLAVCHWC